MALLLFLPSLWAEAHQLPDSDCHGGAPCPGEDLHLQEATRYLNWIGVPTKGEAAAQAGAVTLGVHSTCHNPHPPRKERPFPLQLLKLSLRDHSRGLSL